MAATSEARLGLSTEVDSAGAALGGTDGRAAAPRVLVLVENNSVPADRRVWAIATALSRAGWEVVVACPAGSPRDRPGELREYATASPYTATRPALPARAWLATRGSTPPPSGRRGGSCHGSRASARSTWCRCATRPTSSWRSMAGAPRRRAFVFDHHDLTPELFQPASRAATGGCTARHSPSSARASRWRTWCCHQRVLPRSGAYGAGGKRPEEVFVVRNGPDLRRFAPVRCGPRPEARQAAADRVRRTDGGPGRGRPRPQGACAVAPHAARTGRRYSPATGTCART